MCENEETKEYTHFNLNQQWAEQNIPAELIGEDNCWLCKSCKKDESDFDSQC